MTGRYVQVDVDDAAYKVFYEENGQGIPLVCQHSHDEVDEVVGRQTVLVVPPLLIGGRVGLAVPRQVVGDDPEVLRDVRVTDAHESALMEPILD